MNYLLGLTIKFLLCIFWNWWIWCPTCLLRMAMTVPLESCYCSQPTSYIGLSCSGFHLMSCFFYKPFSRVLDFHSPIIIRNLQSYQTYFALAQSLECGILKPAFASFVLWLLVLCRISPIYLLASISSWSSETFSWVCEVHLSFSLIEISHYVNTSAFAQKLGLLGKPCRSRHLVMQDCKLYWKLLLWV